MCLPSFSRYAEHLGVSPRLIGLLPSGLLAGNISVVFEYIAYSKALEEWLSDAETLTSVQWIHICRQLALAFLRLHQHDVLFNDLHRGNVLIQSQANKLHVYLIDFGYATFKTGKIYSRSYGNFSGYNFIAPENAKGTPSSTTTEVYSLGYVFSKIAAVINVAPLSSLAQWCMAHDPDDRPRLLTVIAKLDSILFGVKLMSWVELSKRLTEYNDLTTTNSDYFVLTKEQVADVSTTHLLCPAIFSLGSVCKKETSEWAWLIRHRRIISPKCQVPLFVLDEHDLLKQRIDDIRWVSHSKYDAIRTAQLKLTNQTVVVKEFYGVPFERIRNEACMTAVFGEMGISPRIVGILIEYKYMNDSAFIQEIYGNGVSLSRFISLTSGHDWDLEFLGRAAEGNDLQNKISNLCPWNVLQFFLGLIKEYSVRSCQAKSHRRQTIEKISTLLVQKMICIHNSGYLINNFRTNNVLIARNITKNGSVDIDIRLIDLRLTSSVLNGIYSDTPPPDTSGFTYIAPEVLRGERSSISSDIYSLCFALYQIMSDYFVTPPSMLTSAKTSQTGNHNYFSHHSNPTIQQSTHGLQSKVRSSNISEPEPMCADTATLRYHSLLLKCLHSEPRDRPHIQELLSVSSLAFS